MDSLARLSSAPAGCLSPLPTAAPIPSIADTLLLCYDASSPRSVLLAAATGLPTVRIRTITALIAWCCAAMERRLSQASTFQLPLLLRRKACQSASGGRHRIESAWMHSHLPHTISLTPLLFCCATPLRLYSYRSAIPIPALLDHRTEGTQQVAPLTTSHREAPLAAFTTHILHTGQLPSSDRRPRSSRRIRPSQLDFREQLMHELLEQHSAERRAVPAGVPPPAGRALVKDHYPEHVDEKRDCVVCSRRPDNRVQSRLVCHTCRVHLCAGPCFAQYH